LSVGLCHVLRAVRCPLRAATHNNTNGASSSGGSSSSSTPRTLPQREQCREDATRAVVRLCGRPALVLRDGQVQAVVQRDSHEKRGKDCRGAWCVRRGA
jgi:nitrite reductase/ring-hydroxylating ferredoxin subunit